MHFELRYAVRQLLKSPGFTLVAIVGLGLGIGASVRFTFLGIVLGTAAAFLVSRLMQQALFEVDSADPLIYLAMSAMLLLVAEGASWLPARRATRIDPPGDRRDRASGCAGQLP